jgi:hypothetical protein
MNAHTDFWVFRQSTYLYPHHTAIHLLELVLPLSPTNRHKAMLSYLHNAGLHGAFESLKRETENEEFEVDDPKAKWVGLLEKKWTSVIRLQKKVGSLSCLSNWRMGLPAWPCGQPILAPGKAQNSDRAHPLMGQMVTLVPSLPIGPCLRSHTADHGPGIPQFCPPCRTSFSHPRILLVLYRPLPPSRPRTAYPHLAPRTNHPRSFPSALDRPGVRE